MKTRHGINRFPIYILVFVFFMSGFFLWGQNPINIMPLGNSITYDDYLDDTRDIGAKIAYRYKLYLLLNEAGYTFDYVGSEQSGGDYLPEEYTDNAGFPGATVSDLLAILQENYLDTYGPDVILLHIGTNGLNTNGNATAFRNHLIDILDEVDNYEDTSEKTVPVILAQIINRAPDGLHVPTTYYNGLLADLATARTGDSLLLVNMETGAGINYPFVEDGGDMIDTYHPDNTGYDKMGQLWFTALESYNLSSPMVSDIPDQTKNEGESFTLSLDDYVFDPQEPDDEIEWTFTSPVNFTVDINNSRTATITPVAVEWTGSETITFTATDRFGSYSSDDVQFTLEAQNELPVVTDIPNQTIAEGETFSTINLDDYVSDADHSDEQMLWTYSGNSALSVTITDRVATIGIPSAEWSGADTITFTATDPDGASDSDDAVFTVTAANVPPVVTDIPNQTIAEGAAFTAISLDNFVS
ncbi:MAG: hypothetical protein JXB19_06890, partial [Bacteroidales bacterium]|nr:hypothetical protein [Bacteroidales bacterium]